VIVSEPIATQFPVTATAVVESVADAYRDASLAGAAMVRAVEVLERFRSRALEEEDVFEVWRELDGLVDEVVGEPLQPVLTDVRLRYAASVADAAKGALAAAFGRDPMDGWREWLAAYAGALAVFRLPLCRILADADFSYPEAVRGDLERMRAWTGLVEARRWPESEAAFVFLADQPCVRSRDRAILLVAATEIQLYRLLDVDRARERLARARELCPDHVFVWATQGQIALWVGDVEEARRCFERAIELDPDDEAGYRGLGDLERGQGNLEEAERRYREATGRPRRSGGAYRDLIDLYGDRELFRARERWVDGLVRHAIAIEPDSAYDAWLAAGGAFLGNGAYDRAQECFDRALAIDPGSIEVYLQIGAVEFERKREPEAREAYRRAIELAPDAADGYRGMATVCELFEHWDEAVDWWQETAARREEWAAVSIEAVVHLLIKAGRHDEAERALLEGLAEYPDAAEIRSALRELALVFLTKLDRHDRALALYQQLREIKGPDFEAESHRMLGDLHYDAGAHEEAAAEFRRALELRVEAPTLLGLSRTLKRLRDWDAAADALERKRALDGDEDAHRLELSGLWNDKGNAQYEASDFTAAVSSYETASELDPTDAVVFSNLSQAWELTAERGRRLQALDQAVQTLRRANELAPSPEYAQRLSQLERNLTAVRKHGELVLEFPGATPILGEVGDALLPVVDPAQDGGRFLYDLVPEMRTRIEHELGVRVPGVRVRSNPNLQLREYQLLIHDVPVRRRTMSDAAEGEPLAGALLADLESALRRRIEMFFGLDEAELVLERLAADHPDAFDAVVRDMRGRVTLARVLRALVRDGVSLTRAEAVLEALAGEPLTPMRGAEALRLARLALREQLPGNGADVPRVAVPDWAETELAGAPEADPQLLPRSEEQLVAELADLLPDEGPSVVVTRTPSARPYLQRLLSGAFELAEGVLADEEVVAGAPT
jgi:tetratricopeptide (TPR) repeat protein